MKSVPIALPGKTQKDMRMFFLGSGLWFICIGIQTVIFPWLLTSVLEETPRWVGIAQMCIMLPVIFLVLPAGHMADRVMLRRHLLCIHAIAALPAFFLALAIGADRLAYWQLILYALSMGSLSAFANPAREAFLNVLGRENLQRAVTINIGIEFGIQVVGFFLGGFAAKLSPQSILLAQAALMFFGAFVFKNISRDELPCSSSAQGSMRKELAAALKVVTNSPILSRVILLNLMIGIFFLGSFFVLIPITISQSFHQGVSDIAMANIAFMCGTISSVVALVAMGGVNRCGRALLSSCAAGALLLILLALQSSWAIFLCILFAWGASGGITLSMGQTLIQQYVPAAHKARILSIFLLCFMGGNPIGSFLIGNLLEYVPPSTAALVSGTSMLACIAALMRHGQLWRLQTAGNPVSQNNLGKER